MHGKTRNALVGYGLDTELIDIIASHGHTIELLRALPKREMSKYYTEAEIEKIKTRIERSPIAEDVIQTILIQSGTCCCYCNDGNSSRPYQIHHIDPYSETQDNSEENLLLVCPTHHVVIHQTQQPRSAQKIARKCWHSTIVLAASFSAKGINFPFGVFQPIDYSSPPLPAELIEFGPLSPSTSLVCYPVESANAARLCLDASGFLLVLGESGSGKSTYVTALGGLLANEGFGVFRHRFDKLDHDVLRQVSLFVSTCATRAVILLDDANTWATAADLQHIAKIAAVRPNVRVIAVWTNDDSDDGAKLHASDLARQTLVWSEFRPTVIEALLKHEGEIVEALQRFESDNSIGSLGLGSLHAPLKERIQALGHEPKTVYEFIFGLRGNLTAVSEELRELVDNDRSDVPMIFAAVEQIAVVEQSVSVPETKVVSDRIFRGIGLPTASEDWLQMVFKNQEKRRRLIRIRDRFTTIHRKWALRLIAAGLSSSGAKATTEDILKPDFKIPAATPRRLLRLWSWLDAIDESRPFVRQWVEEMSSDNWATLVANCAEKGLSDTGFLARQMFRLRKTADWTQIVASAFQRNVTAITHLIYNASPDDWYWIHEISITMGNCCPETWAQIMRGWDRKQVALLILRSTPEQFSLIPWVLGGIKTSCPGWIEEMAQYVSWESFKGRLDCVASGDVKGLFKTVDMYARLGKPLMRSILRDIAAAMGRVLREATMDNLKTPVINETFMMMALYYPDDAKTALESLDYRAVGKQFSQSLPRHWCELFGLVSNASLCGSDITVRILSECDLNQLIGQARRYGAANRYELRVLLHLLSHADQKTRQLAGTEIQSLVRQACESKDSESVAILTAFNRVDAKCGAILSIELNITPEPIKDKIEPEFLEQARQENKQLDASGVDYRINFFGEPSMDSGTTNVPSANVS